ncbi:hypothetical protein [Streptosporangium vulgare]|uniref:Uncharacterized protein n=1 Tax=Streptosporangium vulgare TaxID=46190 RepID=A0ABV5T6Z3_9ACTN
MREPELGTASGHVMRLELQQGRRGVPAEPIEQRTRDLGYLAGSGKHENQILPTGLPVGTAPEALGCACDLYLNH